MHTPSIKSREVPAESAVRETLSTINASMLNELSPYALKRTCTLSEGEGIVSV